MLKWGHQHKRKHILNQQLKNIFIKVSSHFKLFVHCLKPRFKCTFLIPPAGLRKCRDQWPEDTIAYERFYNIFLDLTLLVLPLFVLCVAYFLITRTLYVGMRAERALVVGGNSTSGSTTAKQHDYSSLGAIAIVTKNTAATPSDTLRSPFLRRFNWKMSLRCHSSQANHRSYGIRSGDQDVVAGEQSGTRYHQQQQHRPLQQKNQLKHYGKYHTLFEKSSYQQLNANCKLTIVRKHWIYAVCKTNKRLSVHGI